MTVVGVDLLWPIPIQIHSFRLFLYSASSSPLLLRFAPDTARILCRSFTPKNDHSQLRLKDLGFEPTTLRTKGVESTNEPPRLRPFILQKSLSSLPFPHT